MFAHHDIIMLFICIICCLYSCVCLCTWLSLLFNYSLIFVFVVNTTGLILLVLNIIVYLTRNHLLWFRTFITLLVVLLLTCSVSRFIVIVDSWNANKIQIQYNYEHSYRLKCWGYDRQMQSSQNVETYMSCSQNKIMFYNIFTLVIKKQNLQLE